MNRQQLRDAKITDFAVKELSDYSHANYGANACPSCGVEGITDFLAHAKSCVTLRSDVEQELIERKKL